MMLFMPPCYVSYLLRATLMPPAIAAAMSAPATLPYDLMMRRATLAAMLRLRAAIIDAAAEMRFSFAAPRFTAMMLLSLPCHDLSRRRHAAVLFADAIDCRLDDAIFATILMPPPCRRAVAANAYADIQCDAMLLAMPPCYAADAYAMTFFYAAPLIRFAAADDAFRRRLTDTAMLPPAIQAIAHARQRRAHAAQHADASDCAMRHMLLLLCRDLLMPPCRHAEDAAVYFRACHALRHACFYADALPF